MSPLAHKQIGTIFNIQHFSVNDGPGIRTTVFLKGCPLRCPWCGNPESQNFAPELAWSRKKCIHCHSCVKELPELCCRFSEDHLLWDKSAKPDTEQVDRVCPTGALHVIGDTVTVDDVLTEVEKDRVFFQTSGGGMTLSGGEPLAQPEFTLAVLEEAGKRGIHRAMETCGAADRDKVEPIAHQLDYLLFDIKSGTPEPQILNNLRNIRRVRADLPIRVRTPIIPGYNDNIPELRKILNLLADLHVEYEPLKYHRLGVPKYESLNRPYPMGDVQLPDEKYETLRRFAEKEHANKGDHYEVLSGQRQTG